MSATSALIRKSKRSLANLNRIMAEQSSFKIIFVLIFATLLEVGLCVLFVDGFRFLFKFEGMGHAVVRHLFSLFFFGMGAMLVVSGIVTSYSTIFRSEEIDFLLVRPFRITEIVRYKFLASTGLSSWAFFFIAIPFAGAYAWQEKIPILFALWTFLFSIPFLLLCSALGAIIALLFVRWGPTRNLTRICVGLVAGGGWGLVWWLSSGPKASQSGLHFTMSNIIPGMKVASNALFPSWWTAEGIMSLSRGQWFRGFMLWCVLLSSAMVLFMVIEWLGKLTFYESWQRVHASASHARRPPVLLPSLNRFLSFTGHDTRAVIIKDIRTFLRDPLQWSQALIFFGLLTLYFVNLRSFNYHILPDKWRNTIAFLNVFSVSAVVCSLGSRFIYPQLSLEGHGFWVLGLSPTTMKRILLAKFSLAVTGMILISAFLMLLSASMLNASWTARIVAVALASCISFAVCGMSIGLGAIFLDLKQRNPAAIVSGFGGTLNLALNLGFMLITIIPFGVLFHLHTMARISTSTLHKYLLVASLGLVIFTSLAAFVPLWLGCKTLSNRDF